MYTRRTQLSSTQLHSTGLYYRATRSTQRARSRPPRATSCELLLSSCSLFHVLPSSRSAMCECACAFGDRETACMRLRLQLASESVSAVRSFRRATLLCRLLTLTAVCAAALPPAALNTEHQQTAEQSNSAYSSLHSKVANRNERADTDSRASRSSSRSRKQAVCSSAIARAPLKRDLR